MGEPSPLEWSGNDTSNSLLYLFLTALPYLYILYIGILRPGWPRKAKLTECTSLSRASQLQGNPPSAGGSKRNLASLLKAVITNSISSSSMPAIRGARRILPCGLELRARTRRASVPADPASCLVVFATDAAVLEYSVPGDVFGIDFVHKPM